LEDDIYARVSKMQKDVYISFIFSHISANVTSFTVKLIAAAVTYLILVEPPKLSFEFFCNTVITRCVKFGKLLTRLVFVN